MTAYCSDTLDKQVDSWLAPLSGSDGPCGPDLEYDNAFMELAKAAEGKPETQFEKGAPPEWRIVAGKVEEMFQRTRDLRVAMMWLRATLALHGVVALAAGLRLLLGLLEAHWDQLHPRPDPDDNDPFARANVLAVLPKPDGVTGEVVQSRLLSVKGVGEVRMRDVETAFGIIAAKKGETTFSKEQIDQMIERFLAIATTTLLSTLGLTLQPQVPKGHPSIPIPEMAKNWPKAEAKNVESVDAILKAFYEVPAGAPGEARNWDRYLRSSCPTRG